MRLGIITPTENAEFISEFTDFDVALGYMAMRYESYLRAFRSLQFMKRPLYYLQHPTHIIRDDHYFMSARRLKPMLIATTPRKSSGEQYETYTQYLRASKVIPELAESTIAPYVNAHDNHENIAIYGEIAKHRFVSWDVIESLPLKFVHGSIIVGMPSTDQLRQKRPIALITAYPILLAQHGVSLVEDTVVPPSFNLSPDWFAKPLSDNALALAVENIKALRDVVAGAKK